MKHVYVILDVLLWENVAACSKCCGKDDDEESLATGSRSQDYAALQWNYHVGGKQALWLLIVLSVVLVNGTIW